MDKRLLYVLPLCFLIVIGWSVLSQKLGWTPPPEAPQPAPLAAPATQTAGATPAAAPSAAPPAAAQPEPALPAAIGPVVVDDVERAETIVTGRAGEPGHYRAIFTNRGAALVELRTGNHFDIAGISAEERLDPEHWALLAGENHTTERPKSLVLRAGQSSRALVREPLESVLWRARLLGPEGAREGIEFEHAPGTGVRFVKRFRFRPREDQIRLELEIHNDAVADVAGFRAFVLTVAAAIPNDSGDSFYPEPQAVAASLPRGETEVVLDPHLMEASGQPPTGTLKGTSPLAYAGLYNKYFAVLLRGADDESRPTLGGASWRALRDEAWLTRHPGEAGAAWRQLATDVDLSLALPAPGASRVWSYDVYAGPKQRDAMVAAFPAHAALLEHDLGFTSGIARVLLWILGFFHGITASWGMAIVLLTVLVRALLFPINRRSQTAMARFQTKMKRVQPRIEELKKRYANDPKKLREEQSRLMQEEGAFPPLGGCLPPLLQLPIFIGLFRAIGVSFDLRQAPFLGIIGDLSLPDRLVPIDVELPFLGHISAINVLPPLMVVLWIWQQRTMPRPTEEQALLMYKMMMWMPIVMGVFLYNYAAGLSIYMITQSGLGILEQKWIKKRWPVDETELPRKKDGFLARLMAAQEQRMKQMPAQKRLVKKK